MPAHKHAAAIHAFADGHAIQWRKLGTAEWHDFISGQSPTWQDDCEYQVKPDVPEYPVSSMSDVQLCDAFEPRPDVMWNSKACRNLADTALRVEFEKGNIVTKAEHEQQMIDASNNISAILKDVKRATDTLERLGYTDNGGQLWKPPLGKPDVQRYAIEELTWEKFKAMQAERELAIAKAVRSQFLHILKKVDTTPQSYWMANTRLMEMDLRAIIALVK